MKTYVCLWGDEPSYLEKWEGKKKPDPVHIQAESMLEALQKFKEMKLEVEEPETIDGYEP